MLSPSPCPRRCCRLAAGAPDDVVGIVAVPHTMLSPSSVPHTMLSPSACPRRCCRRRRAPHDVVAVASVPQTMLSLASRSRAPHDVVAVARGAPHDVVAVVGAPDDVVAVAQSCPRRCCRHRRCPRRCCRRAVPQTMLSPSRVPHTMFSPSAASRAPQTMLCRRRRQALARGLDDAPPLQLVWLPQMIVLAPRRAAIGYALPGLRGRVEPRQVDRAACVFRKPAPCVSAS